MENHCNFSLGDFSTEICYLPWEFESRSEAGFLLGDPICFDKSYRHAPLGNAFVLNKQSVLRGIPGSMFIDMLCIDELANDKAVNQRNSENLCAISLNDEVESLTGSCVMSLNGETVCVVSDKASMAWDISSGELKGVKSTVNTINCLVAVRDGFLFTARGNTLELWNFELSECIRRWTDLGNIHQVLPISDERVACVGDEVIILDTTSGDIVSTIKTFHGEVAACNSKGQLITIMPNDFPHSIQLWDGEIVLWERCFLSDTFLRPRFSPAEQFVVLVGELQEEHTVLCWPAHMFVLDAVSGRTLHILRPGNWILDYRFVSDEECVVCSSDMPSSYCIRLFNVKSGDLLSVIALERDGYCLAACPRKRLITIGLSDSKHKVIQVKLPQDKDSKKSNRISIKC